VIQWLWIPACPSCGRVMEHLLTIDSVEAIAESRWAPMEEQALVPRSSEEVQGALCNPTGLMLGDCGHMQLFVCRHCPDFPIVPSCECS